jgi:hypothetical protein
MISNATVNQVVADGLSTLPAMVAGPGWRRWDREVCRAAALATIGFFEQRGSKQSPEYGVPFLYREALDLVQGTAQSDVYPFTQPDPLRQGQRPVISFWAFSRLPQRFGWFKR